MGMGPTMRMVAFLSAVAVVLGATAGAEGGPRFGLKAGVSLATQEFDHVYGWGDTGWRMGLDVGVSAEWYDQGRVSLLTEVRYVQKGVIEERVVTGPNDPVGQLREFESRVDYVSVPLLVRLDLLGGDIRPYLAAGPRVDVNVSHRADNLHSPVYDGLDRWDLGADLVCGVRIRRFSLEGRYGHTFGHSYESAVLKVRNRSTSLLLGLSF